MGAQKILIADDDRAVAKLLAMSLENAGYEVVIARDGFQAKEFARERQPDLCILDVHMPAGGGLSVQQQIQEITTLRATPTIYLTGDKSDQVEDAAEMLGAFAVLYKPVDIARLLKTVRRALIEYQHPLEMEETSHAAKI
jgi:DNA-binding response OmpR family regulator